MPKGHANPRSRAPYALQACAICRARKSKCDGAKPVCGSCLTTGRGEECYWGREAGPRKPRTEAHFEVLRKHVESLQAYADLLEGMLAKCVCQDTSSYLQFRPRQLEEPSENEGSDSSDTEVLDSDDDILQELTVPARRLRLDDTLGGLLLHGITAPFQFGNRPPNEVSRLADVFETNTCYRLLVDGILSDSDRDIDWSRHLPQGVHMDREEHDRVLDLTFKFFTGWAFRIVAPLFLRDMHRALSAPRSQRPPRTPHYSPFLHNALLSVSVIFSDDQHLRDPKVRHMFVDTAREYIEAECKKPDISLVQGLAFLGTYYADIGDRIIGDFFFGMSSRLSLSLGLGVDSQLWVKAGLISPDEMLARNWAHWSMFSLDVCWALYFGRDFIGPQLDRLTMPKPFVDSQFDEVLFYHSPSNLPPQPGYLSLVFFESTSLFMIARKIIDVVCVSAFFLPLNNWKSRLPPELDITPANRANSTPNRLMLHCVYWWCFIVLHRPFLSQRAQSLQHEREIDHIKLCRRAAESILELLETWATLYGVRYAPVTLLQVVFSAGTIFLLLALNATAPARLRIAHAALQTALTQVEQCVRYLHEIGLSWRCAARTGDILAAVLRDKLRPVIARRLAPRGVQPAGDATDSPSSAGTQATTSACSSPAPAGDVVPAAGTKQQDKLSDPSPFYTPDWVVPQEEVDAAWAQMQMPLDLPPQGRDNVSGPFVGECPFPELDLSGFLLPTFQDFLGGPEMWEQPVNSTTAFPVN
ncbi:hypothetical protein B0H15DRAFT_911499 [Mycena belliarum]|uniref:Zn(2)-C6 fungal-type domain-containing protein n=1 Tax=Mycena belliarum TaxID=1033014 RepID=A0AAD6TYT6_9AGAR|nr:hypothetical protein B0H15DRAFT_911499 [Mycena belliae]